MPKKSSPNKKRISQQKQEQKRAPLPELNVYPRRGRQVVTIVFCLVILAIITDALLFGGGGGVTDILFLIFFLICLIYVAGLIWSALRLLSTKQPSFQADEVGLTLRHLPFLGQVFLPWDEIKFVQVSRGRLSAYLYIQPTDIQALIARYGLLRFVLNASTRFIRRTTTPLVVSQALFVPPIEEIATRLQEDYGVTYTQR